MKIKIAVGEMLGPDFYAISLEAEPPPSGDVRTTFFVLHASSVTAEALLFLRAEDLRKLYEALDDYLFSKEREMRP